MQVVVTSVAVMGLFSRKAEPRPLAPFWVCRGWPDIEVNGESYHRAEIESLFRSWGRPAGGVTMRVAMLAPEPTNRYDRNAVKVMIDGLHVGYVPAEDAARVGRECRSAQRGTFAAVPVRIWAINEGGTWRARVTLTTSGVTEPERDFAEEQRVDAEEARKYAESRRVGVVRGQWWTTFQPAVAELKRQGRLDEARVLLDECAAAALRASAVTGEVPHLWPTEQLAIVFRKMKDPAAERRVLEAYVAACAGRQVPDKILERLAWTQVALGGE